MSRSLNFNPLKVDSVHCVCVQSGGAALLEGLSANHSIIDMDIRETECGDTNTHGVQFKLRENLQHNKECGSAADDDEDVSEEEEEDDEEEDDDEEEEEVILDSYDRLL